MVVNVRFEECEVYVGRPSEWGNKFKIGRDGNREEVIHKYEMDLRKRLEGDEGLRQRLRALRGKKLGCWCAPLPCHADVLEALAQELGD